MNKKITTIDDLAVMIEKESSTNEKRFDVLEEKISGLTDRVGSLEETVATKQDLFRVETRIISAIGDINLEIKNHNRRILTLEKIVKP